MGCAAPAPGVLAFARWVLTGDSLFLAVVLTLLAVSGVLRAIIIAHANPTLVSDARDYHVYADNLAHGRGYMQTYQGETEVYNGFTFRAYRSPGYPVFLAGLYAVFGRGLEVALAANLIGELVTQVSFLLIAAKLLGRVCAACVQTLLAIHVLWTPNLMSESVYTALFSVLVLMLVFQVPRRSHFGALACGVLLPAALFTRPITVCLYPVLLWDLMRCPSAGKLAVRLALMLLPSLITSALWTHRNYQLFGQWVLFTTNVGSHNAYDFEINRAHAFQAMRDRGMNEAQINTAFLREECRRVQAGPGQWLKLLSRRIRDMFSLRPAWEVREVLWKRVLPTDGDGSLVADLYRGSYWQYYVTYPLAAVGACVLLIARRRLCGLWMTMLLYLTIHAVVSRSDIRLAAPLYPFMCLFASACWLPGQTLLTRRGRNRGDIRKHSSG